jgi:hypothetical protein
MKYTVEIVSGGTVCIRSFIKIGLGTQVILRIFLRQLERLQCKYY